MEIRIPFHVVIEGEAPPADIPECEAVIPYNLISDGTRTMIEGEGDILCHFADEAVPLIFHVLLEFEALLIGELLPPSPSKTTGWLDAYLNIDGAITQYWVGYPSEAVNPCPENSPCRTPTKDVIPLPFDYAEGSTIETPWIFVLHLGRSPG